ncbi:MAG: GGDEF domain-containing protein [Pseudomonadaceae bacterium]
MIIYNPITLLVLTSLLTGIIGVVLLLMGRVTTTRIPGSGHWAVGSLLTAVAGVLIALRDVGPVWLTYTVENTLVMIAYTCYWVGSAQHFGKQLNLKPWIVLSVLAWCAQTYFTFGVDSLRGRYVSLTGYIFAVTVMHAAVLIREIYRSRGDHQQRLLGLYFTGFAVTFSALIFGVRWAYAVVQPQDGNDLLSSSWLQMLYLGAFTFGVVIVNIGFLLLVSERIRSQFEALAMVDSLTGVRSRRAVVDAASDLLQRSKRSREPFSVLLLDLDHFKAINDQFGHQGGDRVLQGFCRRMEDALRQSDVFGRLGGEEFIVLAPATTMEQAGELAERLRLAAVTSEPGLPGVTVSIGFTDWRRDDASIDDLFSRADRALYAAKAAGRNKALHC